MDTYQTKLDKEEVYQLNLAKENSAYGIKGSRLRLKENIVSWINTLNQYESGSSTVSGKELHKIKDGITNKDKIALEDIKIIGCRFYCTEKEKELKKIINFPKCLQLVNLHLSKEISFLGFTLCKTISP